MMRKVFLVFILLFSFIQFLGQTVNSSESKKLDRKEYISTIIGENENAIFLLKKRKGLPSNKAFSVVTFDKDLGQSKTTLLSLPETTYSPTIQDVFLLNDDILIFYTIIDRSNKNISGHLTTLYNSNVSTLVENIPIEKYSKLPDFNVEVKDDIITVVSTVSKFNQKQTFSIKQYDGQIKPFLSETYTLPYVSKNFKIEKIVPHKSSVYVLGKNNIDGEILNPKSYYLIRLNNTNKSIKEFELTLASKWITSANFEIANDSSLYVGGFYSNSQKFRIAGTFYLNINLSNNAIEQQSLNKFSNEFLTQFMSAKKASKKGELSQYYFNHFVLNPNGSVSLVAEQYYKITNTQTDFRSGLTDFTTTYFYNDIIIVNVNQDGTTNWTKHIPKRQSSSNDFGYFSSYCLGAKDNDLYIVYNDNAKNIRLRKESGKIRTHSNFYRSVPVVAKVNAKGSIEYSMLNFNTNLILRPKQSDFTPLEKNILVLSEKGKYYRLSKITL